MFIKKIKVSNFKGFKNIEVDLSQFNVFIGANASGKSSFVQLFDFIRNIQKSGLRNAISMQGGIEYLRNINIGSKKPLEFEIVIDNSLSFEPIVVKENGSIVRKAYETIYSFIIGFSENNLEEVKVIEDKISVFYKYYEKKDTNKNNEYIGKTVLCINNNDGKLDVNINKDSIEFEDLDFEINNLPKIYSDKQNEMNIFRKNLIIESPYLILIDSPLGEIIDGISIYDINPTLPKKATPITGKAELEENGEILAIVLKRIIENKEKQRKFSNIIKDILPFVNDMGVEKFADKSLLFLLKEVYVKNQYIPATILSDGTIYITALIIALYFEQKKVAIIEEPERNIHPHLISKVVEMLNDASNQKTNYYYYTQS